MTRLLLCLALLLLAPATAQAKWFEASSDHFVIYADQAPREIERFSRQLEQFHDAMSTLLQRERLVPSPSNRLTIFVVGNSSQVRKLLGSNAAGVYAFYMPRAGGSLAIVPSINARIGQSDYSMIALLHEYVHHILLSSTRYQYPAWFSEGAAEFFASANYEKDGGLTLGRPAAYRIGELVYAVNLTVTQLLDPATFARQMRREGSAFYGKSWLLYHYLSFNPARKGQLEHYLDLLRQGQGSIDAGKAAFGDLAALESELSKYLRQPKMMTVRMAPGSMEPGPVTLRELGEGEAAIMPVRIRSRRGVTREQALALLPQAQAVAARYPGDATVLTALAEAEMDAGHDDAAIGAADTAIAIDPHQVNAYTQKGLALLRKAATASDKKAAYNAARQPFQALNKVENDHPLPLVYYYRSFVEAGEVPPPIAVQALGRAVELAPFDLDLRQMLAFQQIRDRKFKEAAANLAPMAYYPHGGPAADVAREILDRLNAGEELDEAALSAIEAAHKKDTDQGEDNGKDDDKTAR